MLNALKLMRTMANSASWISWYMLISMGGGVSAVHPRNEGEPLPGG